jgi:hypothetical protein
MLEEEPQWSPANDEFVEQEETSEIIDEEPDVVTGPHIGLIEVLVQDNLTRLGSVPDQKKGTDEVSAEIGQQDDGSKA